MNFLRKIFTNPIAIAFAIAQWIIVFLIIFGYEIQSPFHFTDLPFLSKLIYIMNLFPIVISGFFAKPFFDEFGQNYFSLSLLFSLNFLLISFQWLLIGYVVSLIINRLKYKETNVSLK